MTRCMFTAAADTRPPRTASARDYNHVNSWCTTRTVDVVVFPIKLFGACYFICTLFCGTVYHLHPLLSSNDLARKCSVQIKLDREYNHVNSSCGTPFTTARPMISEDDDCTDG